MNPKQTEGELRNAKLGLYFFGANSRGGISHMQSEPMEHKLKIESTQAARKENKVFFSRFFPLHFSKLFGCPQQLHTDLESLPIQFSGGGECLCGRQRCCFAKSAVDLFELNES